MQWKKSHTDPSSLCIAFYELALHLINLANFNYLKYNTDNIGLLTRSKPFQMSSNSAVFKCFTYTCIFSLDIRSVCNEFFRKPCSSSNKRLKWVDSSRQDLTEPWHYQEQELHIKMTEIEHFIQIKWSQWLCQELLNEELVTKSKCPCGTATIPPPLNFHLCCILLLS